MSWGKHRLLLTRATRGAVIALFDVEKRTTLLPAIHSSAARHAPSPLQVRAVTEDWGSNGGKRTFDNATGGFFTEEQLRRQMQNAIPGSAPRLLAPVGVSKTFYKRELPCPPAVAFSSPAGQEIFVEALAAGTMKSFFQLIEQFRTQDEPAFCGLASIAMVLNALSIDPRRAWKGPWRTFHEEMLDCCHSLDKVKQEGITITQAACLARCNGASVEIYRHGSVSLEDFREIVKRACSNPENDSSQNSTGRGGSPRHIIVSYSRKAFLQTGDGHFSPIGGYSERHDMVLILDTARFKYPPHWVKLHELYDAMAAIDPSTGMPRGFMSLSLQPLLDSALFTLDVRDASWQEASDYMTTEMPAAAATAALQRDARPENVIVAAVAKAPLPAFRKFLAVRTVGSSCNGGVCTQKGIVDTFLHELRSMELFRTIEEHFRFVGEDEHSQPHTAEVHAASSSAQSAAEAPLLSERLAMVALLAPTETWELPGAPASLRQQVTDLIDLKAATRKVVSHEVSYLKRQYEELRKQREREDADAMDGLLQASVCGCTGEGAGAQQYG
jgi:glutathione gamma-glutamylcysteinyltransferase